MDYPDNFSYIQNLSDIFLDLDNFTLLRYNSSCSSIQNPISNFITMILYVGVLIIGLFGNTLVIYVVIRFSKMQTVTNTYILNLAIADECFLIGIPFLLITMHLRSWHFGNIMCKAYMVSASITQFTSSIFLLIMSADRYAAVCHPISSGRFRTPIYSKIISAIAWLTSLILIVPIILFANTTEFGNGNVNCNIHWPDDDITQSGAKFILYSLIFAFAIPVSLMLCFYCLVIRKLHTVGPKNKSKEKKRSHRKVTKLVLTVITVYVLCWLPYWISQVALIHSSPYQCRSKLELAIFLLSGCLGYSNSAMNPILYAFLSDNFKKSFMKACTCAARHEANSQLQGENSFFPKFGRKNNSKKLLCKSDKNGRNGKNRGGNFKMQGNKMESTGTILGDQQSVTYQGKSMMTNATTVSMSGPISESKNGMNNCVGANKDGCDNSRIFDYDKPPILQSDL